MRQTKLAFSIPFFLLLVIVTPRVKAQNTPDYSLFLKSGTILPKENVSDRSFQITFDDNEKSLIIIQFEALLNDKEKAELKREGIELLDYVPNNAYVATVNGTINNAALKRFKARSIITLSPQQKMDASLQGGVIPVHAEKITDMADVWISFPRSYSFEEVRKQLTDQKIQILSDTLKNYQVLELRVPKTRLIELAEFSFIQYVQAIPGESTPLVDKSVTNSRANILSSNATGFNLRGTGVVIGVGDNANAMQNIDLNNRILNYSRITNGSHGMAVIGIAAGAGIMDEKYTGFAPKSKVLAQNNEEILTNAALDAHNSNMVVTNNSYGYVGVSCESFGAYNLSSGILDKQAFDLPYLQHVFAAGNSGQTNLCSTYPAGFGTVLGSYTAAKNVLSVGNTNVSGALDPSSSKGPVRDGRTKPDLTAQGTSVTSTIPGNLYQAGSGTSFAAPAVAGGLALLYERYRQKYKVNPKNALMKALLCNGATDQGLAGADYSYGYGWMNLLRSLTMLNLDNYFEDSLLNNESRVHSVIVPDRTSQLKIMLYWNDPAASVFSGKTLVNNLDLSLIDPIGSIVLPKILDPAHVLTSATTGTDDINNMEQIVVDDPVPGTYSVRINGKAIPQGPQNYFLVYDPISISTTLTYPVGSEHLSKGDAVYISWDSYGNAASTFKIEYSTNNGIAWNTINDAVEANLRQLSWTVPDFPTGQAKVRIIQNTTGVISESGTFTILGVPLLTLSPVQCEGYIAIQWPAVTGATDYEVMMLKGDEMKNVGSTTLLNYTVTGLSVDTTYFVSVRARINGNPGRRGLALSRKPSDGSCQGAISDNDLKIVSIVSPASSGRLYTYTELLASHPVTIRIRNLDDTESYQPIELGYSLGDEGTPIYWETAMPYLSVRGFYDHKFKKNADMHEIGAYRLKVYVKKASDLTETNNSLVRTFRQLDNLPVVIPFLDQMETLAVQETTSSTIGLAGDDRFDFENSTPFGRLLTFDSSVEMPPANKSIFLDANKFISPPNVNFLDATFNLANYKIATDDIRLSFKSRGSGVVVFVRGKDTRYWTSASYSTNNSVSTVDLSQILLDNAMEYSGSVQVRWQQTGNNIMIPGSNVGFAIDDISLYKATNDIQVLRILPPVSDCGSYNYQKISVEVKNNSPNNMYNILVRIQVDDSPVYNGIIWFVPPGSNVIHTSDYYLDLAGPGKHTIKAWTEKITDINPDNNTAEIEYTNTLVSNFPYLQNFETGQAGWQTGDSEGGGNSNSWTYGTPGSSKINKAASGTKAWKTNVVSSSGNYKPSYLYSPCFEIGGLQNPTMSFSMAIDLQSCVDDGEYIGQQSCDFAYVEYLAEGDYWQILGADGIGTNWYNDVGWQTGWSSQSFPRWHVSTVSLPKGYSSIQFRFVFQSGSSRNGEGIAIDDIHIYDLKYPIHTAAPGSSKITLNTAAGNDWLNFTENNKIVASMMPNGMNLGTTQAQTYLNQQPIRNNNSQYYMNRNFTIKPFNKTLSDQVTLRLYFPDSEVNALVNASGCSGCESVKSAYELSVSKYSNANQTLEDGSLDNDDLDAWSFFSSDKITKVPYDIGYYAEFKTKSFSEFWLAKNFMGKGTALPVELISFDAKNKGGVDGEHEILLQWTTSSEKNFDHFDIELATGSQAIRNGLFSKIAEVKGQANPAGISRYEYTDNQLKQPETLYYRLKIVDTDNSFKYSTIRSVILNGITAPRLFPNPSNGFFNLEFEAEGNNSATVKVFDMSGRLVKSMSFEPTTSILKQKIDLSSPSYKTGLYLIELTTGQQKKTFKVLKEVLN